MKTKKLNLDQLQKIEGGRMVRCPYEEFFSAMLRALVRLDFGGAWVSFDFIVMCGELKMGLWNTAPNK